MFRAAVACYIIVAVARAGRQVDCPACISTAHAVPVRRHEQLIRAGIKGNPTVYDCDDGALFFTHPLPTAQHLSELYTTNANPFGKGRQQSGGIDAKAYVPQSHGPREQSQYDYIRAAHLAALTAAAPQLVVEVGCQDAVLLSRFGGPNRTLVCFEPSPTLNPAFLLQASGSRAYHVIQGVWSAPSLHAALGLSAAPAQIGLFISSHVVEHIGDLCEWSQALFRLMAPGGIVFTEVPNHTREYVAQSHHSIWGYYHLSMPSPRGFLQLMRSAGFVLGQMSTMSNFSSVGAQGKWLRTIFIKPMKAAAGCGLDGMIQGPKGSGAPCS